MSAQLHNLPSGILLYAELAALPNTSVTWADAELLYSNITPIGVRSRAKWSLVIAARGPLIVSMLFHRNLD